MPNEVEILRAQVATLRESIAALREVIAGLKEAFKRYYERDDKKWEKIFDLHGETVDKDDCTHRMDRLDERLRAVERQAGERSWDLLKLLGSSLLGAVLALTTAWIASKFKP